MPKSKQPTQQKRDGFLPLGGSKESEGEAGTNATDAQRRGEKNDEQVKPPKTRRRFSAAFKAKVVAQAERCTQLGEIGALLRREGLFASQLANWRKLADKGKMDALNDNKRGTKKRKDIKDLEIEKLKAENLKLARKLNQAEIIIDLQKKMAKLMEAQEEMNTGEGL